MKPNSYIKNTAILFISMAVTKVVGAVFKIPLANILGGTGMGYFSTAYALYSPILALAAAGVPTVMMRMTAQNMALGRCETALAVKRTALRMFTGIGFIGMVAILLAAYPFALLFANSPESTPAIIAIAPAVLLCCIACVLRGYYEGLNEIIPSAAAAVTESIARAVFGLTLSYGVMYYAKHRFEMGLDVFGEIVNSYEKAHNAALPYAAAAAIAAVSISELAGLLSLIIIDRRRKTDRNKPPQRYSQRDTAKNILIQVLPIAAASLVMNCVSFVDLLTVTNSISNAVASNSTYFARAYADAVDACGGMDRLANFMYGSYTGIAMSLFMLIPSFACMAEKTSAPEIAAAWEKGENDRITHHVRTMLKTSATIGFPACFGAAALGEPILSLLYPSRTAEVGVCIPPFTVLCLCGFFMILSSSLFGVMQAIGKAHIPLILMSISVGVKLVVNPLLINIPQINITGAAMASALSYLITAVCAALILKKHLGRKLGIFSACAVPAFSGVVCAATAFLVHRIAENQLPSLAAVAISVLSGGFVYLLLLISTFVFVKNK